MAQAKLAEFLKERHERVSNGNGEVSAKMTFGEALKIHQQNKADNVTIKTSTRHYWNQVFAALLKSWPGLRDWEIRRITKQIVKTERESFARLHRLDKL